jgi:DNA repair exonuclease SbcCD ATPase subunit
MPATNLCLRFPIRAGGGSDAGAAAAAGGDEAKEDMNAVVEGLREVVKSLRRGREMAEARLELVQQQALRDKSQVQVLQRELTALRHQGNALMSPVPRSPGGAPFTEKERAEMVGNMAAAQQSSAMVEELRTARNQLSTQLQAANQAKNAAVSAKAVAEKAREEAELASSRLQATLSVKDTEIKMWQTKLEKSTERVRRFGLVVMGMILRCC